MSGSGNEEVKCPEGTLRAITCLTLDKEKPTLTEAERNGYMQEALKEIYDDILHILKDYLDTSEENYVIIALWIVGTYFHDSFLTYPYLFLNAMKGSAKTRTLKIIKHLSKKGDMLASLSEAVLFRTTGSLCIDEFERIGDKDKNALRELLNTAYKKGGKVKRMRKRKTIDGEVQIVEEFDTFRPICMANISGMEEVLGDRCIALILEKSNNPLFIKKVEDFEWNPLFKKVAAELNWCSLCRCISSQNIYTDWNKYIIYIHTPLHNDALNCTIPQFPQEEEVFFAKINETGVDGRNLELFFPLLMVAQEIGVMDYFLNIIKRTIEHKKIDEIYESKDVQLYRMVSEKTYDEWYNIRVLTSDFIREIQEQPLWLNPSWMGHALKRLALIKDKRRIGEGVQVKLDIPKAKLKMEIFK